MWEDKLTVMFCGALVWCRVGGIGMWPWVIIQPWGFGEIGVGTSSDTVALSTHKTGPYDLRGKKKSLSKGPRGGT